MGRYLGLHEESFIGITTSISSGAASVSAQMLASPQSTGPARFLVMADADVYVRQGDSTVEADANDMILRANQPIVILVTSTQNNYLAALQVSAAGTVRMTRLDAENPAG